MPKITFVYPDFESLGVEYIMAICLENNYEVDFVYYQAEDPYLGIKVKNISFDRIAKKIADTNPNIAAFSCVTDNYQYQLSCAKALKKIKPSIITIFGGVHPTAVPDKVLQHAEVDGVAIGESEESFSNFLKLGVRNDTFVLPEKPIEGIIFKRYGKVIGEFKNGPIVDLNKLPFPYKAPFFSLFKDPIHGYSVITSRGCPYSCSCCFNSYLHKLGQKSFIRRRSIGNIIDELRIARIRYNTKYIYFCDDCFTADREWVIEFCSRYKKEIDLPFSCITNPYNLNKEIIRALNLAGCVNMQIGIQSLSEQLCSEVLQRKSNNAKIAQTIEDIKEVGIMVQVDHMLGIPGDTLEIQEESLLFYNKYRPDLISIFWLTYYPKIVMVEIAKQKGILTGKDINNIEQGRRLTKESYLTGGSMISPGPYYSIALLYNYLPVLPRWLVSFLVHSRLYRIVRIKNYFISTALPRFIQSITNKKDFRGRIHIARFVNKIFLQRLKQF